MNNDICLLCERKRDRIPLWTISFHFAILALRMYWSQQVEHMHHKHVTEPGVQRSERPLSACHNRRKYSIETYFGKTSSSVKLSRFCIKWNWCRVIIVYCQDTDQCLLTFLNDDFKRSLTYSYSRSLFETRVPLRMKHPYEEKARTYCLSCEI